MREAFTSTKLPMWTSFSRCAPGRKWLKGPTSAPLSMTAPSTTEAKTVTSSPIWLFAMMLFGPMRQRAPIVVLPEIVVFGRMTVPASTSTPGSMYVVLGEMIWTPVKSARFALRVSRAFADAGDEDLAFELFLVIRRIDGPAETAALELTCNQLVVDIGEDAGHVRVVSREPGGSRRCAASEVSGGSSVSKEQSLDSSASFGNIVGASSQGCQARDLPHLNGYRTKSVASKVGLPKGEG